MAAAHSNRSPSPLSSRPTDPNPRNPENNPAIRRSFSGHNTTKPSLLTKPRRFDPVTPANSPSDFPIRRSVSKESTRSSLEDWEGKENEEKDHNFSRLRSPLKGSKNFMSPTISAASKFTPSPRKKVLVERNDPVRTSISLCDGKATFFSSTHASQNLELKSERRPDQCPIAECSLELKSERGPDKNPIAECSLGSNVSEINEIVQENPPVSKPPKKVTFLEAPMLSNHVSESLQESVTTDCVAPLEADPSIPPYDPKTNFLSPRPQFLHYRPNPRTEILMNKEKGLDPDGLKRLEDSFLAEIMPQDFLGYEETDESQTEDSQEEESEVVDSSDMVIGMEEVSPHHVFEPSESLPVSTNVTNAVSDDNSAPKRVKRPSFLFKFMCFTVLLMFLVGCASIFIPHPYALDQLNLKDRSSSDLRNFFRGTNVAASAKANLDRLAKRASKLSADSFSFISELTNKFSNGENVGPLQFINLTYLPQNIWDEGQFLNNHVGNGLIKNIKEEVKLEENVDVDVDMETEAFEEESFVEIDSEDRIEEDFDTQYGNLETEAVSPVDPAMLSQFESEVTDIVEDETEVVSCVDTESGSYDNVEDLFSTVLQEQEVKSEAVEVEVASKGTVAEKVGGEEFASSYACAYVTTLNHENPVELQSLPKFESLSESSENKSLANYVVGISTIFMALCAFAAVRYQQKKNSSLVNPVMKVDPLLSKTPIYQEKQLSQNPQTEVDVMGESCPSELSSFQRSASYSTKERKGENEAQSFERRPRKFTKRESLASSSEFSGGSPSYGSFTTLERIPKKHVNGEDEIVTPVRRSNRIRNQFASP